MINDVNETVGCGDVSLNNCCVYTSTLDTDCAGVITVQDVKVEEFLIDICRDLINLNEKEKKDNKKVALKTLNKCFLLFE